MEEINWYYRRDEYGWLSNFWRAPQVMAVPAYYIAHGGGLPSEYIDNDGPTIMTFLSNENWYQANKAYHPATFMWIASAPHPYLAMMAGRALRPDSSNPLRRFRSNWDSVRTEVMLAGLRTKFAKGGELAGKLLATGKVALHEDSPTDMYWGKKGKDMLGKLLMQVREELRS